MTCTHPRVALAKKIPTDPVEIFGASFLGMKAMCRDCGAELTVYPTSRGQGGELRQDEPEGTTYTRKGSE